MRTISEIAVHCTATPAGRDYSVAEITAMHRARGFSTIGYHFLISRDGSIRIGRPVEQVGAHVSGHNLQSIGVSYVGGLTSDQKRAVDTRTPAQKAALRQIIGALIARFPGIVRVQGHRDYSPDLDGDGEIEPNEWIKQCPCFDAIPEYADLLKHGASPSPASAAPAPVKISAKMLVRGSRGPEVIELQRGLARLGFFSAAFVDNYGPKTEAAVIDFQRSQHLVVDGKAGMVTKEAIARALAAL